eukprot:TRINITY_DN9720_c0_g1_i3.p1 TRINITY_DN9720_c0_g1~~TRINITY_DN9720_c0_g1_i3.p1  ORF type:complete len:193 (-),score=26.57 TRINITY_DN9720_c0_g1_i3:402-980(-)
MGNSLPEHLLLATILVGSFTISGVIFGWAPLLLIFRDDGTADRVGDSLLTLTYTGGVIAQTSMSFFAGTLVDLQGPSVSGTLGAAIAAVGIALVGVVRSQSSLPIGYALIGGGACVYYFASFRVSFRYPDHQALVLVQDRFPGKVWMTACVRPPSTRRSTPAPLSSTCCISFTHGRISPPLQSSPGRRWCMS